MDGWMDWFMELGGNFTRARAYSWREQSAGVRYFPHSSGVVLLLLSDGVHR